MSSESPGACGPPMRPHRAQPGPPLATCRRARPPVHRWPAAARAAAPPQRWHSMYCPVPCARPSSTVCLPRLGACLAVPPLFSHFLPPVCPLVSQPLLPKDTSRTSPTSWLLACFGEIGYLRHQRPKLAQCLAGVGAGLGLVAFRAEKRPTCALDRHAGPADAAHRRPRLDPF